jgi:rhodanese-related sulfurtransferase
MGPLVPDFIGNELNLIVAIFCGIGFGFVLEQAGFSTSKKLVGLFYGYDFTVLRVFFTAGVTAMIGVVALAHFGLLDMNLVFVNPTFLWSAIVGGFIMGLGFVIGGFCPGTGVCAAAIGKIDGMFFMLGTFIGVLIFAEGYPLFEGIYKSANYGGIRMYQTLGISQALFAFLLILMAVGAFWFTSMIENRVNGIKGTDPKLKKIYIAVSGLAVIIGLSAFVMPDRKEALLNELNNTAFVSSYNTEYMTSDELAFRIIDKDADIQIIDLRAQKEYDSLPLPQSTRFSLAALLEKDAYKLLSVKGKINVITANDELTAKKGYILCKGLGYENLYVLQGGLNQFRKDIIDFKLSDKPSSGGLSDTEKFRTKAALLIPKLIQENKLKNTGTEKKQAKRVIGGC